MTAPPWDGFDDLDHADLAELVARDLLEGVYTSMHARVESYDAAKECANLQPIMRDPIKLDELGRGVRYPVLHCVPVRWPRFAGFEIRGTLVKGDTVVVHFLTHAIDEWLLASGVDHTPFNRRRSDLNNAWCEPGLTPFASPLHNPTDTDLVIRRTDGTAEVRIAPDGTVTVTGVKVVAASADVRLGSGSASDPVALSSLVDALFTTVDAQLKGIGLPGLGAIATGATKVKGE